MNRRRLVGLVVVVVMATILPVLHAQNCNGVCVALNKCSQRTGNLDDGSWPDIDLRVGQENSDVVGDCPHYLDTCCPPEFVIKDVDVPVANGEDETFSSCGQRNTDGVGFRIGNGKTEEAEFGEFPWTLLIIERQQLFDFEEKEVYACVASLVAPNVALTVAHCVVNRTASSLVARAGEWDTRTENEVLPYQDASVKEILIHERYNKQHHYDVSLLVLKTSFRAASNVQTICLPPVGVRPSAGTECITGGWGKDRFGKDGIYQQILKRVQLPIIPNANCQQSLRKTRLGAGFTLHSSFLCAGGKKDMDVCSGDGGAALVCLLPGSQINYYQAGVVAWGIGCGDDSIPGVYADIPSTLPWILKTLQALKVDPVYYTAA